MSGQARPDCVLSGATRSKELRWCKCSPPDKIRNVALVGHSGSGKTTLAEAMLFRAGSIGPNRLPSKPEPPSLTTTLRSTTAARSASRSPSHPFVWRDHKINIIDTPGYADFAGDLHAALRVTDLAIFVVDARSRGSKCKPTYAWRRSQSDLGTYLE